MLFLIQTLELGILTVQTQLVKEMLAFVPIHTLKKRSFPNFHEHVRFECIV